MYTSCAKIENGIVTNIIVCQSIEWAISHLGGEWLPVYDGNPCGIGWAYDGENFIPPEPTGGGR